MNKGTMATKSNTKKLAPKRAVVTKAMLEKSLSSVMAESEALNLNLAETRESRDILAGQLEVATEAHLAEVAALQEKIMLLTLDIERKDGLLEYVKGKLTQFAQEWKELRGKPWKRFWRAVAFLGEMMDIIMVIINKIDDEHNWGGAEVNDAE